MTFADCEPWFYLYQKVARSVWYPGIYVQKGLNNYIYMFYPDGTQKAYYPSDHDKQATDWYVPDIDQHGFECCVCHQKIRHEEPVCDVWQKTSHGYKMDIRHRNCEAPEGENSDICSNP